LAALGHICNEPWNTRVTRTRQHPAVETIRPNAKETIVKLVEVEHALGMMRTYLLEYAAQDDWSDHRTEELTDVIRACVQRIAAQQRQQTPLRDARLSYAALRQAIRFVNENLDSKLRWDDIAAHVGLNAFAFGRGFKLATGTTPHQYTIRCRLRRAMKLLARGESSLADVAFEVGFSCQSHLTTMFRKYLGTTPGAFRLSALKGEIAGTAHRHRWQPPTDLAPARLRA